MDEVNDILTSLGTQIGSIGPLQRATNNSTLPDIYKNYTNSFNYSNYTAINSNSLHIKYKK